MRTRITAVHKWLAALALAAFSAPGCHGGSGAMPPGGPCDTDSDCEDDLLCWEARCRQRCQYDGDCASGHCVAVDETGAERVCLFPLETSCTSNGECPGALGCSLAGHCTCGNGLQEEGEQCDQGEENGDGSACRSNCAEAACGDGFLWTDEEDCDDGEANSDSEPDACRTDCARPGCGDEVIDDGEECDAGDENSDIEPDACRSTCVEAFCGDGVIDTSEECDLGEGNDNGGACLEVCLEASCGDGHLRDEIEQCDDGDDNSDIEPDACRTNCETASCGDGVVDDGEECDPGDDESNTGPCLADCTAASCGDGYHWLGREECDGEEGCLESCRWCAPGWTGEDCETCVRYVWAGAPGPSHDGLTLERAYTIVQEGIDAAVFAFTESGASRPCEVWVHEGTYFSVAGDPIRLRSGVHVYGGFAGGESRREARDVGANPTVLDGSRAPGSEMRVDHVLVSPPSSDSQGVETVLDGFFVLGGSADGTSPDDRGGGMLIDTGTPIFVRNCFFIGNAAHYGGGAIAVTALGHRPFISNSVFVSNSAVAGGAIYAANYSDPQVENCTFTANSGPEGAAIYAEPGLVFGQLTLRNSILWGDIGPEVGTGHRDGRVFIHRSIVQGMTAADIIDENPRFTAPFDADDPTSFDLRPAAGSPAIDAANGCWSPLQDFLGSPRVDVEDVVGAGSALPADLGAFEHQSPGAAEVVTARLEGCCSPGVYPGTRNTYWFCPTQHKWIWARAYCEAEGARLADVASSAENEFVSELVTDEIVEVWLGGNDLVVEGSWRWLEETPLSWDSWAPGHPLSSWPTQDCLAMTVADGTWIAADCLNASRGFVCESAD